MSYKFNIICMKVIAIASLLLFFQPAFSQYDFSGVDQLLQRNQKTLGNNVVALVYKDGKIVYQKNWVNILMLKHKRRLPVAVNGLRQRW
jgi:hypothetical protein